MVEPAISNPISLDLTSSKLGKEAKLVISSTDSDFVSTPPPIILIFSDSFVKLTNTFAGAIASSEEPIAVGPVKRVSRCSFYS